MSDPTAQVPAMVRGGVVDSFMATLETRYRLAKYLVASGLIPQKTPEAAVAIMLKAYELDVPPMQAFASIHFFDGKLVMDATLMDGLASIRCGVRKKILASTDKVCRIEFSRAGWEPITAEFTVEEAKTAGLLSKSNWQKYPKDMLAARCKARGLRLIAPDFFAGTYALEEVEVQVMPEAPGATNDINAALDKKAAPAIDLLAEPVKAREGSREQALFAADEV